MAKDSTVYRGERTADGTVTVTANGAALSPKRSQAVWNHSPDGFEWGYGGSGPAQLALALLLDVTNNKNVATREHQSFKRQFVATWERDAWEVTAKQIRDWLALSETVADGSQPT